MHRKWPLSSCRPQTILAALSQVKVNIVVSLPSTLELPLLLKKIDLSFLVKKSIDFIPLMTLCFLHGILVSLQSLGVLLFRYNPSHEHLLD